MEETDRMNTNDRLIHSIKLTNFLSFGSSGVEVPLLPLNIIIGPNGSGKSNLIEAIDLLRNAPKDFHKPIREGGGVRDWLWKGSQNVSPAASVDVMVANHDKDNLRYFFSFANEKQVFKLLNELVEKVPLPQSGKLLPVLKKWYLYQLNKGKPVLKVRNETTGTSRDIQPDDLDVNTSILAQRRDPYQYPELTYLAKVLEKIAIYRDWQFGRYTPARLPQKADLPSEWLLSDASNLGLVLNRLRRDLSVKKRLLDALRELYNGIEDYDVQVEANTVQVFFHEGNTLIPATRLSDGTLRYLCLLAILCHPNPPPLVCIEEPELGLHPDIMPALAKLLKEASTRCQLIVTTHSAELVDAMTDQPESVLVCERGVEGTTLKRLDAEALKPWLEKYRLGDLWTSGEIGGDRW